MQYVQVTSMCSMCSMCSMGKYVQVCASMCKEPVTASGCFFPHRKMPAPQYPTVPHSAPPPNARLLPPQHFPCRYSQSQGFALIVDCHHLCLELCLSSMDFFGNQHHTLRGKRINLIQLHKLLFKIYFLVYIAHLGAPHLHVCSSCSPSLAPL